MTDFASLLQPDRGQPATSIHVVRPEEFASWLGAQPPRIRTAIHQAAGQTAPASKGERL